MREKKLTQGSRRSRASKAGTNSQSQAPSVASVDNSIIDNSIDLSVSYDQKLMIPVNEVKLEMEPPNLSPINKFQKWVLDQGISDNKFEEAKIEFSVIDKVKDPEKKLETLKNLILYDPMDFDSLADKYLPVVNSIWDEIKADSKNFSETI